MLEIRAITDDGLHYLDLYGNEDIMIEMSFAEVQDVTKKNSVFTHSFKLPGSKKNNNVFNHFYDANASMFDFNVKEKFLAEMVYNGEVLYNGYLRLNSTTRIKNEVIYDVTFYSEVGDLVSNIQDKYLSDLTLPNTYNVQSYPFNLLNQYSTDWDPDLNPALYNDLDPLKNGKVYFSILNRGYSYTTNPDTQDLQLNAGVIPRLAWQKPLIDNIDTTYWDSVNNNTPFRHVPQTYMTGHLRVKDLYETIFSENGYQVNSDFFETAYFKRIYMPLTVSNEGLSPVQSIQPQFIFGSTGATTATSVNYACTNYDWYEGPGFGSSSKSYRFSTSANTTDIKYFYVYSSDGTMLLARPGTYRFRITFDAVSNDDGDFYFAVRNAWSGSTLSPCWDSGYTTLSAPISIESGLNGKLTQQVVEIQINTWEGDSSYYAIDFKKANNADDIRIVKMDFEIVLAPNFIDNIGWFYKPLEEFVKPDIKQIDFISSVNKLFNLIVLPDPDNPNSIRVEPIIDWIGKGVTLDWTDRVNRDAEITVQPLTTIINGTLNYNYKEDGASSNKDFKTLNSREFGQNIVELNTDYRDSVLTFDNIFSAQVDSTLNVESTLKGFTIPNYFASKTENNDGGPFVLFNPYKTTPKLLFRSVALPIISLRPGGTDWLSIDNTKVYKWANNNRFNTYPFGASGLTHAMVWNKNDRFDSNEFNLSDYEDLYDVYYKDYIEDLVSPENRLIGCEMYFDPYELRQLKFNEKIFLDGNYYRVNKIGNYSLTNGGLAKVELVKLTKEYQGHRVLYYDLIHCSGGTDLHTSTDLNFGAYYLRGYNVNISGVCYTVSGGTYNSGYTYQALDLTQAYTDCNCNVSIDDTGILFYDDKKPYVTPTPTPEPLPCGGCTYYEWENENPYLATVTYKSCETFLLVTDTIGANQIYTACTCNNYTIQLDPGVLTNFTEECYPNITPTPTPTLVTATQTPTPSITPNGCYEYNIENDNPYNVTVFYTDCCTGLADSMTLPAYASGPLCSLTVPTGTGFRINSVDYGCSTPCPSPTPTPSVTPNPPTPSPTPTDFIYVVENCDDPGDIRNISSTVFIAVGKVVRLSCCPTLCFEITGDSFVSPTDYVTNEFLSCESCPR